MNRDFDEVNNSLTEQIFQQAKLQFENNRQNINFEPLPLNMLPSLLESLKISMPESMMKDYLKTLQQSNPKMNFKQFTHYIARASLQTEVQEQLQNLFNFIDRDEAGTINAQDIWMFIKHLQATDALNQKDVDNLMKQLDRKQMGFLSYQDFLYGLLPK